MELFSHEDDNPNSIITNDITDIKLANGNNLWISTFHYGVDLFDTKNKCFTHYNNQTLPSLCSNISTNSNVGFILEEKPFPRYW